MTLMPDTNSKEGLQNECCDKELEFYFEGDGVEWEMWECSNCKLKYVIPIEIKRYFNNAEIVTNGEDYE